MSSEWAKIDLLRAALGGARDPRVLVGIGDDAAVLAPGGEALVWTIDAVVDGVHFRRHWLSLRDLGYRATMAAASDLAAMGASPRGVLAALVLPEGVSDAELAELAAGQREAAEAIGTAVIGGNLARGGELSITTTVLGSAPRPIARAGARPGDRVWLAGDVGLAAAGLDALMGGAAGDAGAADEAAVRAWRRPRARIEAGIAARGWATAGIDVSDGLAQDVGHVAHASSVRVVLDARALVSEDLAAIAHAKGKDALAWALSGGEDYALVMTGPDGEREGYRAIGWVEEGEGVGLREEDGKIVELAAEGFDHFRAGRATG